MQSFKVLNDCSIGHFFMPNGLNYSKNKMLIPSPVHGRSVAVKVSDYEWILVKGGGWNYGGPLVYCSKKEDELIFGLYSKKAAIRELKISKMIENVSNDFPKVLYYKSFCDYHLPTKFNALKKIKFSNGNLVEPCLLYTKVRCPYRVADLIYFTDKKKETIIGKISKYLGVKSETYLNKFIEILAKNVAILHKNDFVNDTLEYSNVTLLGEIVDYELVGAPGIPFDDGLFDDWKINERKEKEILYGVEVVFQLSHLIHKPLNLFKCYKDFVEFYKEINPSFIEKNKSIKKILKGETIIL